MTGYVCDDCGYTAAPDDSRRAFELQEHPCPADHAVPGGAFVAYCLRCQPNRTMRFTTARDSLNWHRAHRDTHRPRPGCTGLHDPGVYCATCNTLTKETA